MSLDIHAKSREALGALARGFLTRRSADGAQVRATRLARAEAKSNGIQAPSPFLPTPHAVVSEMLTMAGVTDKSIVLDIGCGDGRVPIAAVKEKGAEQGIGFESLPHVYEKAVQARLDAGLNESQVELYSSDFTLPNNHDLLTALDRSNVIFVFLLPGDMSRVVQLVVESVVRKDAAAKNSAHTSISSLAPSPNFACPCPASVHTRLVSWTFSLPSTSPLLALPLQPTCSVPLQSAQTKLHMYDLCACHLQRRIVDVEERHATHVARAFAATANSSSLPSLDGPNDAYVASASPAPCPSIDLSSLHWGHALNTVESLLARLNAVYPHGLFIECDLRVHVDQKVIGTDRAAFPTSGDSLASPTPSAASSAAISSVILSHDAGSSGPSFTAWYDALYSYHVTHPHQPIGLKLDFKELDAVSPTLRFLREKQLAGDEWFLSGVSPSFPFLWFNADILLGPGAPLGAKPIPARPFFAACKESGLSGVLSVGWVTGSNDGPYTHDHVSDMIHAVEEASVSSTSSSGSAHASPSPLQFTYPLRASLVRRSWSTGALQRLLSHASSSTLTIWTSLADQSAPSAKDEEQWIRDNLPKDRTFIDVVL